MKKLLIAIYIVSTIFVAASCNHTGSNSADKANRSDTIKKTAISGKASPFILPPNGLTLNGVSTFDANNMVSAFVDDNTSSDTKTDIWLSKTWINEMYNLLTTEGADGFHIYFAKDTTVTPNKNTVVIVSTKGGYDDYYDHISPFLQNVSIDRDVLVGNGNDPGATLYNTVINWPNDTCSLQTLNYISNIEAWGAVKNFIKQRPYQGINTKCEWFPICLLYNLREELNASSKYDGDGIRIYFAKKTKKAGNPIQRNRHCFIVVTTKAIKDQNGKVISHQDYYQCYNKIDHCDGTAFSKINWANYTSDNGEECPNNCKGVTLPNP